MNRQNRIVRTHGPALVDALLRPTLHLGVAALHRGKVEFLVTGAGGHARGRAATQTNEHGRTADNDEWRTGGKLDLMDMFFADIAESTGKHDWLVIAAHFTRGVEFETAEVTGDIRPAEFVIERRAANRPFEHD